MKTSRAVWLLIAGLGLAASACEQSKSANPLSPDVAGPIPGVAITAPTPMQPANGQQLVASTENVTFLFGNPQTNGERPLWVQFQLASDVNFQQVLHQADRLTPGENGQTRYQLTEKLGTGGTYYWRVRGLDGANTGPYSSPANFTITDPVVIDAPVPAAPIGQLSTTVPEFRLTNGRVSGPAKEVVYRIEVATSPDPASIIAVLSMPRNPSGTTVIAPNQSLPFATTYFWRAYATDGDVTSPYSAVVSFRTAAAPPPAPAPSPSPTPIAPQPGTGTVGGPRNISESEVLSIVRSVHDSLGYNLGSRSSRDGRNAFWATAMAVVHYGHARFNPQGGDRNWCIKDGGNGRPQSDDVAVRCGSRDAWDMIGGAGGDGYSWHLDYIGRLDSAQNVYAPSQSSLPR
jgi:hypothetical protein